MRIVKTAKQHEKTKRYKQSGGAKKLPLKVESKPTLANKSKKETAKPKPAPKILTVQLESARFKQIQETELALLRYAEPPKIKSQKQSSLTNNPEFKSCKVELEELGFEFATFMSVKVPGFNFELAAMTNEEMNFDAILMDGSPIGDRVLRLAVQASHSNDTVTCVGNLPSLENPENPSAVYDYTELALGNPEQLVQQLQKQVARKKLVVLSKKSFLERYIKLSNHDTKTLRENLKKSLENSALKQADGFMPRFEKCGVYLRPYDFKKQVFRFDSRSLSQEFIKSLKVRPRRNSKANTLLAKLKMAAELCVFRHLEFVGAPSNGSFVDDGIVNGLALFDALQVDSTLANKEYIWLVPELVFLWTMLGLKERWGEAHQVATQLKASFAPDSMWPRYKRQPKQLAALLRVIAKEWSQEESKRKPVKTLRANLKRSKCEQSGNLLAVWDAILGGDQQLFAVCINESLEFSVKRNCDYQEAQVFFGGSDREPFHWACWMESFLVMLGVQHGLRAPKIKAELKNWLLVPQTVIG